MKTKLHITNNKICIVVYIYIVGFRTVQVPEVTRHYQQKWIQ